VSDERTGAYYELAADPDKALDVFNHPYAYAACMGLPYEEASHASWAMAATGAGPVGALRPDHSPSGAVQMPAHGSGRHELRAPSRIPRSGGVLPRLRPVQHPAGRSDSSWNARGEERVAVRLTFSELALIHKALQAVKTLGSLPPQDELLTDTMQTIDV